MIAWPDGDRVEKKKLAQGVNELALKRAGDWAFDRAAHGGHRGQVTLSLLVVQGRKRSSTSGMRQAWIWIRERARGPRRRASPPR